MKACVDAGYDSSHEKRQELIAILSSVQEGGEFPEEIMKLVLERTSVNKKKLMRVLKPQVKNVLEGMKYAVQQEEERRAELLRLEEEERQARERAHQEEQQRLQQSGKCPAGFTWHRYGTGWRCAGGSHFA